MVILNQAQALLLVTFRSTLWNCCLLHKFHFKPVLYVGIIYFEGMLLVETKVYCKLLPQVIVKLTIKFSQIVSNILQYAAVNIGIISKMHRKLD
jgi:hypothetical protein